MSFCWKCLITLCAQIIFSTRMVLFMLLKITFHGKSFTASFANKIRGRRFHRYSIWIVIITYCWVCFAYSRPSPHGGSCGHSWIKFDRIGHTKDLWHPYDTFSYVHLNRHNFYIDINSNCTNMFTIAMYHLMVVNMATHG